MATTTTSASKKPAAPRTPSGAGDLIFVRPAPDDWIGELVARATDGPYCHVRIRISAYEVVEALTSGIARTTLASASDPADVAASGAHLQVNRTAHALAWLLRCVGRQYGWYSIAADALGFLLPKTLGSRTPFLVAPHRFDCSELAVRYLTYAGYCWLPDEMTDTPETVSPNALARALGVLK